MLVCLCACVRVCCAMAWRFVYQTWQVGEWSPPWDAARRGAPPPCPCPSVSLQFYGRGRLSIERSASVLLSCAFVTRGSVSQSHRRGLVIGHAWPWWPGQLLFEEWRSRVHRWRSPPTRCGLNNRLKKYSRVFRPWGSCAIGTQFAGTGAIACALRKKVEGGGTTACLEHLLGKRDGGVGATGWLRYCYQRFGESWGGERAWNICLEKGTAELVPRGGCDIATNVSVSLGKGSVLGIFAWKKGRWCWCHGVPAILLPTSRGALGRGACLEYLLGKRDGAVGATGCLRYCYQLFGEPWEGERAWNICL